MVPASRIRHHMGKSCRKFSPGRNQRVGFRISDDRIENDDQANRHEEKTVFQPAGQRLAHDKNLANIITPRSTNNLSIVMFLCRHFFTSKKNERLKDFSSTEEGSSVREKGRDSTPFGIDLNLVETPHLVHVTGVESQKRCRMIS